MVETVGFPGQTAPTISFKTQIAPTTNQLVQLIVERFWCMTKYCSVGGGGIHISSIISPTSALSISIYQVFLTQKSNFFWKEI